MHSTMPSSSETIPSASCLSTDYAETVKIPSPSVTAITLHLKPARHWAFRSQLVISLPKETTKLPLKENRKYTSDISEECAAAYD